MKRFLSVFIILAGLMSVSCKENYVASVTELQLASVSPATGYPGAIITVYGRNFSNEFGENKVFIGEKEAKVLEYNSWDLTVVAPEQEVGTYSITVVTPKGSITGLSFDYVEKPEHEYIVSTIAGNGKNAHADGAGTAAQFSFPEGIVLDKEGNLWVSQRGTTTAIRKIDPNFNVTTVTTTELPWHGSFAPDGSYWFAGKPKAKIYKVGSDNAVSEVNVTGTTLNNPMDVRFDKDGNAWICNRGANEVCKVAGTTVVKTYEVPVNACITFDAKGRAIVGSETSGYLYMIDGDNVVQIAGTGAMSTSGNLDGTKGDPSTATIGCTCGIFAAKDGSVYFCDRTNLAVRKITPDENGDYTKGTVKTLVTGSYPSDLYVSDDCTRIYLTCATAHVVKLIEIF
ncbi:MAG: IPT/TIG domain-containing protein [Bacteroidales bacterium]|nr:IPT/TIG domain-containing protein [Bacteroidales bacterium]